MKPLEFKDAGNAPEMPPEMKKMQTDINSALDQLMKSVDSKNNDTIKNLTDHIGKYNEFAEKFAADKKAFNDAIKSAEKKAEDAEKRVKDLETTIGTKGIGHNGVPEMDREEPEYKGFFEWFQASKENVPAVVAEQKSLLRTDVNERGGYLIPPVMDGQIRKKVVELSPVRAFATQRTMTGKSMSVAIRKALLDSYYEGEAEAAPEDNSKYGEETVTAYRHSVVVRVTLDQLIMSPFNMEAEVSSDVGQSFAKKEGKMFLTGTGSKQPQGVLIHPEVQKVVTKTTALLTFDDIANLLGALKVGYNPMLFFNRFTFSQLIQLKDGYDRPLWTPVAGDKPATIWDQPYTSSFIDMDSLAAGDGTNGTSNSIPMMYADLSEGYEIFDLMGMSVIRDDVTQADKAIIKYTFRRYNTGKVLMPEAIKLLKVK